MFKYIVRRILISIPVLLGITMVIFLAYQLAPGDPVLAMIQPGTDPRYIQARRIALGLDKPVYIQYLAWLREVLHGNLGYSYRNSVPVVTRIRQSLPATLELNLAATVIAVAVGVPLGIMSAIRQHSFTDLALTLLSFAGISIPVFFLSLIAIYIFALRLDWFPTHGMRDPMAAIPWLDHLHHLMLPALVSGFWSVAGFLRYTRSCMLEVLGADYMRTARAKGLRERTVLVRHGLRSALIPVVTYLGLTIPWLLGGSIIVESIFSWPGMGQLAIMAVGARDYPVIMGIALVISTAVLIANLVTDISYVLLDPRIRYG